MSRSEHHSRIASIVWHEHDGVRYVGVTGEIDLTNSASLAHALDAPRLDVNMAGVRFIDAAGLRPLIDAAAAAAEFELVASRSVRRLLELAGVAESMNVTDRPSETIEGFSYSDWVFNG
jgi:anti-anti-sigma factor